MAEEKKYTQNEVDNLLIKQRVEILEDGLSKILAEIKNHVSQSQQGHTDLKEYISKVSNDNELKSIQCMQELKTEFYAHLGSKYATREYVDDKVKYAKLSAIFGAVAALSSVGALALVLTKLGGT